MNYKYSFVIPIYNGEKVIKRCLDSVLLQSFDNYEVVIVNDGSVDNSISICNDYYTLFPNIRIISQNNSGPGEARNVGIKNSRGQYILFVDQDDFVEPNLLENIDRAFMDTVDILKYNVNYLGDRLDPQIFNTPSIKAVSGDQALLILLQSKKLFATTWMYAIRKELFFKYDLWFEKNNLHEDYGLIPRLIYHSRKFQGIEYIGYNYVYTPGSLSTNQDYEHILKRAKDMLIQYDILHSFSKSNFTDYNLFFLFECYIENNVKKKLNKLRGQDFDIFRRELKKRKII